MGRRTTKKTQLDNHIQEHADDRIQFSLVSDQIGVIDLDVAIGDLFDNLTLVYIDDAMKANMKLGKMYEYSAVAFKGWLKWTTSGYKLWNTLLPGVDDVKYHLPKDTDAMQNGTDLTDLVYDDGTILKHMVDVFNRDIIVVDYSTFINDRQERVLKIVFFFPDDEQPYRVFTQSKVLITVIPDIAKTKPFEPFKTRIIERNKCYTLAHTETI